MAKKKFKIDLKVAYDAPVTLTFVIICAIIFLLNMLMAKGGKSLGLENYLASPTTQTGVMPFIPSAPVSFVLYFWFRCCGECGCRWCFTSFYQSDSDYATGPCNGRALWFCHYRNYDFCFSSFFRSA